MCNGIFLKAENRQAHEITKKKIVESNYWSTQGTQK